MNAQLKARYFKEFWETPQENLKIESIKFGVFSDKDIDQLSSTQITSSSIYNPDTLKPNESGPLDPRLGVSGHTSKTECASCHLSGKECMGHFGHIDLVLPCFHIGFIKDVIQILRMICKSCSRVLLSPSSSCYNETPSYWRQRMSARILSRTQYQSLFKQVIAICKKRRKCSYCGELNGDIKKHQKSFRILHQKYQKIQENISSYAEKRMLENEETAYYLELYDNVADYEQLHNSKKFGEFERSLNTNTFQDFMPWDVMALFQNIIPSDYVLIGLRFAGHRPEDLILTKLPVPPSIIRPGARLDDDKANDDDLTAQLAKIVECNNLITIAMEKGANVATIIENFFFLNKKISEYFISDLPGYPTASMKSIGGSGRRGALAGTQAAHKGKKIRSFSDRLKGKFGRFRGNLSGKRVNFSGRTVISPDPNLELDELGVPIDVCKLLTFCEMVTKHNIHHMRKLILNGPHRHPGAVQYGQRILNKKNTVQFKYISLKKAKFRSNVVNNFLKYGDTVERHLQNRDIILFNRQPSLHRVSIMSHRVKVVPHRTFRFNPCCCNPYNADFDGDEMNIHVPQTLMARAEAQILMNVTQNFAAPKAAEPLVVPLQDIITSTYLLTLKRMFLSYSQVAQLVAYMDDALIATKYVIPEAAILKPIRLWTGKQMFSMLMKPNGDKNADWPSINLESEARNFDCAPVIFDHTLDKCMDYRDGFVVIRNGELMCGNIDKNILGSSTKGLFFRMLRDYGSSHTARCMTRLTKVATRFLYSYGFSIGIRDVTATTELVEIQNMLVESGYNDCNDFLQSYKTGTLQCAPGCDTLQTLESAMNRRLSQIREDAGKQCINKLSYYYNAPLMMAECGSKGSKINISQMVMMVGQQTVGGSRVRDQFIHRTLPHFNINSKTPKAKGFVQNSFFTGISATEFFFHTMGGREGLVDTAVKTATTGYMQRRLMKNIEDISVEYDYTVRNCKKNIVQFIFGHDGIDPMCAENTKSPVNFAAILRNIRAKRRRKNNIIILSPQEMLSTSNKIIFSHIAKKIHFVRRNVTYLNKKCELLFEYEISAFVEQEIFTPANDYYDRFGCDHWYKELYGYTLDEISQLILKACDCYITCIMEPGSAVGGVSATSLGEPATQMTLKTFHFAGVASMNITQGVPRIKEIINATPNMKTPVMTMQLEINNDADIARIVKSRIDITHLGSICLYMQQVIRSQKAYVECVLDLKKIGQLHLELTNRDIATIISCDLKKVLPKIKGFRILASDIRVATKHNNLIRVQPRGQKVSKQILGIILNHLLVNLQNVKIKGTPKVNRALIHKKQEELKENVLKTLRKGSRLLFNDGNDENKKEVFVTNIDLQHGMLDIKVVGGNNDESFQNLPYTMFSQSTYQLYVEGKECFLDILNVSGINSKQSVSNDIIEVSKVLGIEAATATIVNELTSVYHSHGLKVDQRHLMLVGDLMTYTGKVLGFTRHGMMGKEDKSILTMASYEETVKHLFQAALHGEKTKICGVSDSIIVGTPIPIGTGACSVLRDVDRRSIYEKQTTNNCCLPKRDALLLGKSPFNAMTNNDIIVS